MDVVFDIDGTLASAAHRMHYLTDPDKKKDWENFMSENEVANDEPIGPVWDILDSMLEANHRIIFITGRPERLRTVTYNWLTESNCIARCLASSFWERHQTRGPVLYMRREGDRRSSEISKRESLNRARMDGFKPKIAFEDRASDTAMWRSEGLICCQVDEGDF